MDIEYIRDAIDKREFVYFCENRGNVNQVVECIPVVAYCEDGSTIVGVFIPNGIRVATVELALIGRDPFGAQASVSKRNSVIAGLIEKCWRFSGEQIEFAKQARSSVLSPGVDEEVN